MGAKCTEIARRSGRRCKRDAREGETVCRFHGNDPPIVDDAHSGHTHNRGPRGRYLPSMATAERDAEAARLRSRGMTLREIAAEMGWADHSSAADAVSRAFAAVRREGADEALKLALDKLDFMYGAALKVLETQHYTVSDGRLVYLNDEDSPPLDDDSPVLHALDRLLRVEERRSKLLGTDAPVKSRVEVRNVDSFDAAISGLLAEMDARGAVQGAREDSDVAGN